MYIGTYFRDVRDGWAEWAIAHPGFARIEKTAETKIKTNTICPPSFR